MKKTVGVGLLIVGGLLTAAAVANMPAISARLPVKVTSKIPVVPTGNNKWNAAIGVALIAVGFYLRK